MWPYCGTLPLQGSRIVANLPLVLCHYEVDSRVPNLAQ